MDNFLRLINLTVFFLTVATSLLLQVSCTVEGQEGTSAVEGQEIRMILPVFPGAEGFGTNTVAGRQGGIVKVTNLEDSGPGSLRLALQLSTPRIIIFEVGGTIELSDDLLVEHPFVTIAGQTAPSPGVTLKGAGLIIKTHDVLVQHLRIRVGDALDGPNPISRDALKILGPSLYNVVIDHVSASWSVDEIASTWYELSGVTILNSIFSEGLDHSIHPKGQHSAGFLVGGNSRNIYMRGNLFAHNVNRNPRILGNSSVLFVNNLIYNAGNSPFMSIGSSSGPCVVTVVANVFMEGPDSPTVASAIKLEGRSAPGSQIYLYDNQFSGRLFKNNAPDSARVNIPPIWFHPMSILPRSEVENFVLTNVGARPRDRDSVDKRIIREVRMRTGSVIDSQEQVGGWPQVTIATRPFATPNHQHKDDDCDGYTNIEEVLHQMARDLEFHRRPY